MTARRSARADRLDAIEHIARAHAAIEAAQLAGLGWSLRLIHETLCEGLAVYIAGRVSDAIAAGIADWEADTLAALEIEALRALEES